MPNRPDLHNLLTHPTIPDPRGAKRRFDSATANERRREQSRRSSIAQRLAIIALRRFHPEDWSELLAQATTLVADELGPLPGD